MLVLKFRINLMSYNLYEMALNIQ